MKNINAISKLYKFDDKTDNLSKKISKELELAARNGCEYFIIGNISERVNGFKRGSIMSNVIYNLKTLKEKTNIKLVLKNTYEDINFYKTILEKVPGIHFKFDKRSAEKYSKNTLEEWNDFIKKYETIKI